MLENLPDLSDFLNDEIVVEGNRPKVSVETDCPNMADATEKTLDELYKNSPTARGLIDQMVANGTKIDASDLDNEKHGRKAGFANAVITWDPFQGLTGPNGSPQSSYTHAPIIVLAHEIAHAALRMNPGPESESKAIELANQIAAELNAASGSSYDTARKQYADGTFFDVESPFKTILTIVPVGCK